MTKEYQAPKLADLSNQELLGVLALVNANNVIKLKTRNDLRNIEAALRANDAKVWPVMSSLPFSEKGTDELFEKGSFMNVLYHEARARLEALPGYAEVKAR